MDVKRERCPAKCHDCGARMEIMTFPHTDTMRHKGIMRTIHVEDLRAPKCTNCGKMLYSRAVEGQIIQQMHKDIAKEQETEE